MFTYLYVALQDVRIPVCCVWKQGRWNQMTSCDAFSTVYVSLCENYTMLYFNDLIREFSSGAMHFMLHGRTKMILKSYLNITCPSALRFFPLYLS